MYPGIKASYAREALPYYTITAICHSQTDSRNG